MSCYAMQDPISRKPRTRMSESVRTFFGSLGTMILPEECSDFDVDLSLTVVPIADLGNSPFELTKKISVVVECLDASNYVARYETAGLAASGNTVEESVENLKDIIVAKFSHFSTFAPNQLGPLPRRQLHALRSIIRRKTFDAA